jgi:hypothetical protein
MRTVTCSHTSAMAIRRIKINDQRGMVAQVPLGGCALRD